MKGREKGRRLCSLLLILALLWSALPVAALAGENAEGPKPMLVAGFDELDADVARQAVPAGTAQEELNLPETLGASVCAASDGAGAQEAPDVPGGPETATVPHTIEGVAWALPAERNGGLTAYNEAAETGSCVFTPILPEGYALAEGVELPAIHVQVENDAPDGDSENEEFVQNINTAPVPSAISETWDEAKTLTGDVTLDDGAVVTVSAPVTVTGAVTISGGAGSKFVRGSGYEGVLFTIATGASLTLRDIILDGGGVYDADTDTWSGQGGNSIVSVGVCPGAGPAIPDNGALILEHGAVVQNQYTPTGTALGDIHVSGAMETSHASGAAIHVYSGGALTMNGGSTLQNGYNAAKESGAGVCSQGTFTMNGGTISGFTIATSNGTGGGVCNLGTFTMEGGIISGNRAATYGGGVANGAWGGLATFTLRGGEISGNSVTGISGVNLCGGGGVYNKTAFHMEGGRITQNTVAQTPGDGDYYDGGGVYLDSGGSFAMRGGEITLNRAGVTAAGTIHPYGQGGGLMIYGGTATLTGGTIAENEAGSGGGIGLFVYNGKLTLEPQTDGDLMISENTAQLGGGLFQGSGVLEMKGGTISDNAASNGGGVYVKAYYFSSVPSFSGGKIFENTAGVGADFFLAASKTVKVGNEIQVPDGLLLMNGAYLTVAEPFTGGEQIGLALNIPPAVPGTGVLVAQADTEFQSGVLTDADRAHLGYDGSCVLKLGTGTAGTDANKIYAYLSAEKISGTIDYEAEQLKNLPISGQFTVNGGDPITGSTGTLNIASNWFNTTLELVKKGENGYLDSAPQILPIPARPAKPNLTVTPVSRPGLRDGAISGVTEAMEYSADGGAGWTTISSETRTDGTLTGLAAGDYLIRVKASNANKNFRSEDTGARVSIRPYAVLNTPLDITADSARLGGSVTKGSGDYHAELSFRAAGAADWTTLLDEDCTEDERILSIDVSGLQPETLYEVRLLAADVGGLTSESTLRFRTAPAGALPQGTIEATVTGDGRNVVVSIQHGNVTLASVSGRVDAAQPFSARFTGLVDGVYNVVCESTGYVETRSVTMLNGVASENPNFALPVGFTNTVVKIKTEETPPAAVQGLPALITDGDKTAVADGGSIEYALLVEKKTESSAVRADDVKTKAVEDGKESTLFYLDFSMVKTTISAGGQVTEQSIGQPIKIIEIAFPIPGELIGKRNLTVYRAHDNVPAEALTKLTGRPGTPDTEGFYVDEGLGYLFIYAQKFSTYAIAYEEPPAPPPPTPPPTPLPTPAPDGGGSGGGSSRYTLTYESNGGTVFPAERHSEGAVVKLTKAPAREGFTFLGWYSDKTLTKAVSEIKMTSSTTVYAKWEPTQVPGLLDGENHSAYVMGCDHGLVHPGADITRAEVAQIFYRLLREDVRAQYETTQNSFSDVDESAWHNAAISTLAGAGILTGRWDGTFGPHRPITRAEFAAVAARFDSEPYDGPHQFTDISGHWASGYIDRAAARGWVMGGDGGAYRPDDPITRAEAVTIINRVLQRVPESADALLPGMKTWPDNADPSAWYYLAIQEATNSHSYERGADGLRERWTSLD